MFILLVFFLPIAIVFLNTLAPDQGFVWMPGIRAQPKNKKIEA